MGAQLVGMVSRPVLEIFEIMDKVMNVHSRSDHRMVVTCG